MHRVRSSIRPLAVPMSKPGSSAAKQRAAAQAAVVAAYAGLPQALASLASVSTYKRMGVHLRFSDVSELSPERVAWVMAEKGITDLEVIDIDLLQGEHRTEAFLGKVGIGNVPALELDSGTVITESVAICRYLESLHPDPNLFGTSPEDEAVIEMWTRRAELMLAMPLMLTVRHSHPALAVLEKQSPEIAERNRGAAEKSLRFFDRQLAAHPFIAGDRITIADIVAFIGFDFARMAKFAIPETMPNLTRWAAEMRARPSAGAGV